jgi:hypothetical protein
VAYSQPSVMAKAYPSVANFQILHSKVSSSPDIIFRNFAIFSLAQECFPWQAFPDLSNVGQEPTLGVSLA